jgi:hypothetical protein
MERGEMLIIFGTCRGEGPWQINALLYQLYALTPEEVATIEGK